MSGSCKKMNHDNSAYNNAYYSSAETKTANQKDEPKKDEWVQKLRNTIINVWDKRTIVIGLDIDSIASAVFLQTLYPGARVVALYDTENIIVVQDNVSFADDVLGALWLDQDVLLNLLSIGQHLITADCDQGPLEGRNQHSFNPNELFEQCFLHSFRQNVIMGTITDDTDCADSANRAKFPYSTLMLLLHAFNDQWRRNDFVDAVLRHADSVGSNVNKYSTNCEAWRRLLFDTRQSQINLFLQETKRIYNSSYAGVPCACRYCESNRNNVIKKQCICEYCAQQCSARAAVRNVLQSHLSLMADLEQKMPHYFDSLSRASVDIATNSGGVTKASKSEQIMQQLQRLRRREDGGGACLEPPNKRMRFSCTEQTVDQWLALFSGYQGLMLKHSATNTKMCDQFDSKLFLSDLNAFYAYIAENCAFAAPDRQQRPLQHFDCFVSHRVNRPDKTKIQRGYDEVAKRIRTMVYDKYHCQYRPFDDFIREKNIFSYAIIEADKLRYTAQGGCLTDPKNMRQTTTTTTTTNINNKNNNDNNSKQIRQQLQE